MNSILRYIKNLFKQKFEFSTAIKEVYIPTKPLKEKSEVTSC